MESFAVRSFERTGVSSEIVALMEGGFDAPHDLAVTMARMSAATLAPVFFQSEGTVNLIGAVLAKVMGPPLGDSMCCGSTCPGDSRTSSLVPYLHHSTVSPASTDRQ
jgi:hypothetical protein